jgi:hypothetical protein
VFSTYLEALSSNFMFLNARVVKGLLCNMYLPRVMNESFSGDLLDPGSLFKKKAPSQKVILRQPLFLEHTSSTQKLTKKILLKEDSPNMWNQHIRDNNKQKRRP